MGKLTVYVCDICEEKSEEDGFLKECWLCKQEVCKDCSTTLRLAIEDDDEELLSVFKLTCAHCASDKQKIISSFKEIL